MNSPAQQERKHRTAAIDVAEQQSTLGWTLDLNHSYSQISVRTDRRNHSCPLISISVSSLPSSWVPGKGLPTRRYLPSIIEVKSQHCPDRDTDCWSTCRRADGGISSSPDTFRTRQRALFATSPLRVRFLIALGHEIMWFITTIQSSRNTSVRGWVSREGVAEVKMLTGKNNDISGRYCSKLWYLVARTVKQPVQNKSRDASSRFCSYCNYAIIEDWQMLSCNGIVVLFIFLGSFVVNELHILYFPCCANNWFCFIYSTKTNSGG